MHINKQAFISLKKKITDCLIYCTLRNGEVIKYHKFISVVVIELSVRCFNTGPEDRLAYKLKNFFKILVLCIRARQCDFSWELHNAISMRTQICLALLSDKQVSLSMKCHNINP